MESFVNFHNDILFKNFDKIFFESRTLIKKFYYCYHNAIRPNTNIKIY
jgi:hypothetical protein